MHPGYRPWVQPSRLASTCPWGWDRNIADPTTPTPPRVRGTQQARRAGVRIVRVDRGLSHKHPWNSTRRALLRSLRSAERCRSRCTAIGREGQGALPRKRAI
eukprot:1341329-Prymnesium_polylepis.1